MRDLISMLINKLINKKYIFLFSLLFFLSACKSEEGLLKGFDDDNGSGGVTEEVFLEAVACEPSGNGRDFPVGPGQLYENISDVPWSDLGPGDTVRIYYRDEPYREKIVIRSSGTEQKPIRVCGVPGPNGERPVLDGDGAENNPDDAEAYTTYTPMEGLAMVMIYNHDYDIKDRDIVIDGLHIKNAKKGFTYTRTDGTVATYEDGAACIRIQAGDNIVIRNNELENCGNGIFTMSQEYNEAHITRNLLIEGNYIHGNGQPGSYLEHGVYIQAIGVTYQFNRFGPNALGAEGVTLKERVAGSVIRYNWFESGSSRLLDLVEVEDAAPWYIEEEYRKWASQNGEPIDPERLKKVRETEKAYRKTYVYGNFFRHIGSETEASNIVHYGSDNDPDLSRKGTLYFYNNTLYIEQDRDDSWRFRLFYLGNRDAQNRSEERVELFNNIIHYDGENGTPAYLCLDETNGGTINIGKNWLTDIWQEQEAVAECYGSLAEAPTVTGAENLPELPGALTPVDPVTLAPRDLPMLKTLVEPVPTELPPVTREYARHLKSRIRDSVTIVGAMQMH